MLKHSKSTTIALLVFVFCCLNSGFSATINGYITDASSGEPLPVASVVIVDADRGTSTNLDGYFVIDHVKPGIHSLQVTNLGYHGIELEVVTYEGKPTTVHCQITPSQIELEEVEVVAESEKSNLDRLSPTVSAVSVDSKVVRVMPSMIGEMDVLRALQTIPGVKSASDMSSALYIRGGSPDQTLILMDYNVVYNPNHLFGLFSTFNADAVKHIDLMKGGFPAAYGGRSGSVLEIIMDDGNRKEMHGLFSIGLVSARISLEGPLPYKNGSFAGSFRRTYTEPLINAMKNAYDVDLPDYYFYDGNGKINLDLSDRTTLTIAGYWGDDHLAFQFGPDDSRFNMGLSWGNRTLSTRVRTALGSDLFFSVSGSVSRYRSKWFFENDGVMLDKARGRLFDNAIKSNLEIYSFQDHKIKTGIWVSHYDAYFKEENEDMVFVEVSKKTENYSWFAQDRWRIHSMVELQPGIRTYFHKNGDQFAVDPRFSSVFHYSPETRIKFAAGRYSQFINVMSLGDQFSSFDIWFPIDNTIKPGESDQVVLGFEKDFDKGFFEGKFDDDLELTTEMYFTDMRNVAAFNPMVDEGNEAKDAFVLGDGIAYGVEWMIRKKSGRLNGWLGYSLSWTKRQFEDTPAINNGNEFYPKWDRRHDFILISNYKLSRVWDMSVSWRYNTGQGFTQALGVYTERFAGHDPFDEGSGGRATLPGEKNNYRLPDDHRLDLGLTYNHLIFGKNAKFIISVWNAYSRRAYYSRSFSTEENPIEVQDAKLLPILPLFSYEVRF